MRCSRVIDYKSYSRCRRQAAAGRRWCAVCAAASARVRASAAGRKAKCAYERSEAGLRNRSAWKRLTRLCAAIEALAEEDTALHGLGGDLALCP